MSGEGRRKREGNSVVEVPDRDKYGKKIIEVK